MRAGHERQNRIHHRDWWRLMWFKKGDTVRTKYLFNGMRRLGRVLRRNGACVYVKTSVSGLVIEAYDSELEAA